MYIYIYICVYPPAPCLQGGTRLWGLSDSSKLKDSFIPNLSKVQSS